MTRLLSAKEAKELATKNSETFFDEVVLDIAKKIYQACENGNYECKYRLTEEEYKTRGYRIIKHLINFGYCVDTNAINSPGVAIFNTNVIYELTISWKSFNEPKPTE